MIPVTSTGIVKTSTPYDEFANYHWETYKWEQGKVIDSNNDDEYIRGKHSGGVGPGETTVDGRGSKVYEFPEFNFVCFYISYKQTEDWNTLIKTLDSTGYSCDKLTENCSETGICN